MARMPLREAEEQLRQFAVFSWLIGTEGTGRAMWSVQDVADGMRRSGLRPNGSAQYVRELVKDGAFHHAIDYAGNVGIRIPREDLVVYFAEDMRRRGAAGGA